MSNSNFVIGEEYSRKDIFQILKISPEPTGGNWFTGYTCYNDEHYVFVNIDSAGRTGHLYGDHWQGDGTLYWFGKTRSRFNQPAIQKMLNPANKVHFFTRDDNRDTKFIYRGLGHAVTFKDTSPVEVIWRF